MYLSLITAPSSVVPIRGTFSWPLAARGKPRRGMLRRAVFSDVQRKALEKMFQKQKYISKPDRKKLASKLGLKDSQVNIRVENVRATIFPPIIYNPYIRSRRNVIILFYSLKLQLTIKSLQTGENLVPEPANEMEKLQREGAAFLRRLPRTNPADQNKSSPRSQRRG